MFAVETVRVYCDVGAAIRDLCELQTKKRRMSCNLMHSQFLVHTDYVLLGEKMNSLLLRKHRNDASH